MTTARPSFGFESRAGQFSYPFLISGMLLVHRYVYPENPGLRSAEFYLSLALLVLYVICESSSALKRASGGSVSCACWRRSSRSISASP